MIFSTVYTLFGVELTVDLVSRLLNTHLIGAITKSSPGVFYYDCYIFHFWCVSAMLIKRCLLIAFFFST